MSNSITLYHFTSEERAEAIIKDGFANSQRETKGLPEHVWNESNLWQRQNWELLVGYFGGQQGQDTISFTPGGWGSQSWFDMVQSVYPHNILSAVKVVVPKTKIEHYHISKAGGVRGEVIGIGFEVTVRRSIVNQWPMEIVDPDDVLAIVSGRWQRVLTFITQVSPSNRRLVRNQKRFKRQNPRVKALVAVMAAVGNVAHFLDLWPAVEAIEHQGTQEAFAKIMEKVIAWRMARTRKIQGLTDSDRIELDRIQQLWDDR